MTVLKLFIILKVHPELHELMQYLISLRLLLSKTGDVGGIVCGLLSQSIKSNLSKISF